MHLKDRRSEKFFNASGEVVVGYDCGQEYPQVWWVPSEGASLTVGYQLFKSRREALIATRIKLQKMALDVQANLDAVEKKLMETERCL